MRLDRKLRMFANGLSSAAPSAGAGEWTISTDGQPADPTAHEIDTAGNSHDGVGGCSVDWLLQTLSSIPMPASPIDRPWDCAVSSLVQPHLPAALRRLPRLLDQLGAVRLSPTSVSIDSTLIDWHDVTEVRAQPVTSVLTAASIDSLDTAVRQLLPLYRLTRRPAQWLTVKVNDVILSVFLIILNEHGNQQVPTEIIYRHRSGRERTVNPGILSTAVLALPKVADCVLSTARFHGASVVLGPQAELAASADAIRLRIAELAGRVANLRATEQFRDEPTV